MLLVGEHEFKFLQPNKAIEAVAFASSLLACYVYFNKAKTYDIFNYEAVYKNIGGEYAILKAPRDLKFYNQVISFFAKKYNGISFDWKVVDKDVSSVGDSIRKVVMPESYNKQQTKKFLNNSDETARCLQASIWHHDENAAIYCLMLNPIFVILSLYIETNFGVLLLLDFVILGMLSYFQKLTTHDDAKFEGESLLVQVN